MKMAWRLITLSLFFFYAIPTFPEEKGLSVFVWREKWRNWDFINFGDELAHIIVERIVHTTVKLNHKKPIHQEKRLFSVGSVLSFALDDDVIWGTGINGRLLDKKYYKFTRLDVRAVRGPLTRQFLKNELQIDCPEIYGDPALLFPILYPEFQKQKNPSLEYLIIPHFSEEFYFPKTEFPNVVYSTEPWDTVIRKILDSKFVISSSLHGVIVAESFGIPARLLRITDNEPMFKYHDYYLGTGRPHFQAAYSIEQALQMGGEPSIQCDLTKLLNAFPLEFWENR